jgi:uncharacterized membrane protein
MRPDRFFLLAGLLYGLAFVFATPPFQVPDEPAHFYRAYAVSEGNPSAQYREGGEAGLGAVLPASLEELGAGYKEELAFHSERRIAPERILRSLEVPLEPERRRFVDFRTSAQFTLVPYLPQAAGIAVARWLGAPALGLLYAARLANLLAATALIALALRRMPSFPWLMTMLALTPMAVFLRGSASADTFTMAAAFLLAGTAAGLAWAGEARGGWGDVAILTACSAALCFSKPVYLPLAFVVLLIPADRLPGGRRAPALLLFAAVTAAAFGVGMATAGAVDLPVRLDAPVDRDRQIESALEEPFRVAWILTEDYLRMGRRYLAQVVGQLGWLDANLPKPLLWGYAFLLGLLVLFDARRTVSVSPGQRLLLALVALATLALVSASQYAAWTPYGADYVEGIQGRYFIPLAPAAAWIFHTGRWQASHLDHLLDWILPWLSLLSFAMALWTVLHRYYGILSL